jgi:uncharacterized lipoprotein
MRWKKFMRGARLFGALALVVLCACGGEKSQTHDDGNYATATTTVTPPAPSPDTRKKINAKSSNSSAPLSTPTASP